MHDFAFRIFPNLEDDGKQASSNPSDGDELLGNIGPAIEPIRLREQFLNFFESDPALGIIPEPLAFP